MNKMESESCGPECDCEKSSGNTKVKIVVCLIVLLAVGTILAYKANSASQTAPSNADKSVRWRRGKAASHSRYCLLFVRNCSLHLDSFRRRPLWLRRNPGTGA